MAPAFCCKIVRDKRSLLALYLHTWVEKMVVDLSHYYADYESVNGSLLTPKYILYHFVILVFSLFFHFHLMWLFQSEQLRQLAYKLK